MIWRDIPGFSKYEASDEGAIRFKNWQNNPHAKPIRTATKYRKWLYVCMYGDDGRKRTWGVHRLVALAFLGAPPDGHEVAHHDGDGTNNRIGNLRYATYEDNQLDVIRHKRRPTKLHVDDVIRLRELHATGRTTRSLASQFNIGKSTVWAIVSGKKWSERAIAARRGL